MAQQKAQDLFYSVKHESILVFADRSIYFPFENKSSGLLLHSMQEIPFLISIPLLYELGC